MPVDSNQGQTLTLRLLRYRQLRMPNAITAAPA
jgi:hypothetical protein